MFAAPAPPSGPRLTEDRLCRHCGYNLRTQPQSGKCPECATPVALSMRGDLLKFADPAWVRVLALGASMVGYAIVGSLLAVALLMIVLMLNLPFVALVFLIWPLAGAAMLLGLWLVTRNEPSAAVEEGRPTTRRVTRIVLLVTLVLIFVLWLVRMAGIGPLGPLTQVLAGLIWTALTVVWVLVYFRHLADLCERIPDPALIHACRRTSWLIASLLVLTKASDLIVGRSAFVGRPANLIEFIQLFTSLLAFVLFLYFLRAVGLQSRIAKRLRQEALLAQQNWTQPAPSDSSPQSTKV